MAEFDDGTLLIQDTTFPNKGVSIEINHIYNAVKGAFSLSVRPGYLGIWDGRNGLYGLNVFESTADSGNQCLISSVDLINNTISGSFVSKVFASGKGQKIVTGNFNNIKYYFNPAPNPSNIMNVSINGNNMTTNSVSCPWISVGFSGDIFCHMKDGSTVFFHQPNNPMPHTYPIASSGVDAAYISPQNIYYPGTSGNYVITSYSTNQMNATFNFTAVNQSNSNDIVQITNGSLLLSK